MASLIRSDLFSCTKVLIDNRFAGGVAIIDRSLIPPSDIFRVLGIGVAVKVKTSA